jgi:hypothetical protein
VSNADVSKDHSAFIFRDKQSKKKFELLVPEVEDTIIPSKVLKKHLSNDTATYPRRFGSLAAPL